MTNYEVRVDSGTLNASTKFGGFPQSARDKVVYISDSATFLMDMDLEPNAMLVGLDSVTLANETGTLKFRAPYKVKLKDLNSLVKDPRILWATDGSREVDRGSGLTVQNLGNVTGPGNGTKGSGVLETGVQNFPTNLVYYTDMQTRDNSGNLTDLADNDNTSTVAKFQDITGTFGRGADFNNSSGRTDERIELADHADLDVTTFNLAAWVKPAVATGIQTIFYKDLAYFLRLNGTTLELGIWDNVGPTLITYTTSSGQFTAGEEFHIVGVYNGADIFIRKNGSTVLSTARTATTNNSAATLFIGNQTSSGSNQFKGTIDEAAIWNPNITEVADIQFKGKIQKGWVFDGTANADITIADNDSFDSAELSLAFFVRGGDASAAESIIQKGNIDTVGTWQLRLAANDSDITFNTNSSLSVGGVFSQRTLTATGLISDTTVFTHVGLTYDGKVCRLFKNGVVFAEKDFGSYQPLGINTASVIIGGDGTSNIIGILDEIYIFNKALQPFEMQGYANMTESAFPYSQAGVIITETGIVNEDTVDTSSLSVDSGMFWGFDSWSTAPNVREPYRMFVQGKGWSAFASTGSSGQNYILNYAAPGFILQTTTAGLREDFIFDSHAHQVIAIEDRGADDPRTTTINRLGNVSRIKKVGFNARRVRYTVRIDLTSPAGITMLRRLQEIGSTLYKDSNVFNLITDKHILLDFTVSSYDENTIRGAPWKIIEADIEFVKRVL